MALGITHQLKRGIAANCPVLALGELYYATDSNVLYVGTAGGNALVSPGPSTLAADTDVVITSPANNDVLTYETSSTKWKNKPASGGGGGGTHVPTGTLHAYGAAVPTTPAGFGLTAGQYYNFAMFQQGGTAGFFASTQDPPFIQLNGTSTYCFLGETNLGILSPAMLDTFQYYAMIFSTTSGIRVWMGMGATSAGAPLETATPAASFIGFRFDAAVDTHWMAVVTDGSNITATSTGITPDTTTFHQFKCQTDGASGWLFYVDGVLKVTMAAGTTGIPTAALYSQAQIDGASTAILRINSHQWWTTF
jgi:hypothetical protein